jgi:hypothetical protein
MLEDVMEESSEDEGAKDDSEGGMRNHDVE